MKIFCVMDEGSASRVQPVKPATGSDREHQFGDEYREYRGKTWF